jgi:hypothetical protein
VTNKYEIKGNENYAATVVTVTELHTLDGLDRLKGLRVFGYQALVPASTPIGSRMVVFVAGCRLSHEFVAGNNLYRHSNLNADGKTTGYIEDNRRVQAIALRKNQSDALAMPLESLDAVFGDWRWDEILPPGAVFDTIEGKIICEKYTVAAKSGGTQGTNRGSVSKKLVPDEAFPEHYDTDQFARNAHKYSLGDHVIVTQKLHGTSVRFGNVLIPRKLTWVEKLARFFGAEVQEQEYAFVAGSRRVAKSVNGNGDDLWSVVANKHRGVIPPGFMVYGEIVGWTPGGAPIQKNYTYDQKPGCCKLFVYRVTTLSTTGLEHDLAWCDVEKFCERRGLDVVPTLMKTSFRTITPSELVDVKLRNRFSGALQLSDPKSFDEGVCIRNQNHVVTKHKSPLFLQYESKMMDEQAADIEGEQAVAE